MTTVLVTGANGFVGRVLCAELVRRGYKVRAAVRNLSCSSGLTCELVEVGDIDSSTDWSGMLDGVDVVIHLVARVHLMNDNALDPLSEFRKVNLLGTERLARDAAAAGVKRMIFLSSIKVNGEQTFEGQSFTESDKPHPRDAYAVSKHEAEQSLLLIAEQTGMEVVIIRPPLVYGPGVKANFASMMRAVQRGVPLPLGAIHNKRSLVYVENLVSLILRCIDHPEAANQIFLVSDGNDLSTTELLRGCAKALGVNARLLPIPQGWIEVGARLLGKQALVQRLCGNLQVDISKARMMLGWAPPESVAVGLKATAQSLFKIDK